MGFNGVCVIFNFFDLPLCMFCQLDDLAIECGAEDWQERDGTEGPVVEVCLYLNAKCSLASMCSLRTFLLSNAWL